MPAAALPSTFSDAHATPSQRLSTVEQLAALGCEINTNQYRAVHLAAHYECERDWFSQGFKSAAFAISNRLDIQTSTAREWIRVGHSLPNLPLIDAAFKSNRISYAKARILTRWADPDNEHQLLELSKDCSANRLTTAIAKALAENDPDEHQRDQRHHQARSVTTYTDGDGMTIIRIAVAPAIAKPVIAAVDKLVTQIAQTPTQEPTETNRAATTTINPRASADASEITRNKPLTTKLADMHERWHPDPDDDWQFPTLAQQRADAFTILFSDIGIDLTTEIVIHVRGDGCTFDDGTPITTSAICRQLDNAYIRLMIHEANRTPIDASNRRRHPTTRQKRVALERHDHQCVDCQTTDLLQLDHNPPYEQTNHTITTQLEPRCAPYHRARHRAEKAELDV